MDEYIQVGVTAMRDPAGNFLPSVPLYIRAEDQDKVGQPYLDDALFKQLVNKWKEYEKSARRERKKRSAD